MKKVVRLTEADLINLIKGTINELEHDAEGYAKYVKREDYLNATSILVQNELIDNGLDVYAEEHLKIKVYCQARITKLLMNHSVMMILLKYFQQKFKMN